jgi:hypothetical protein
MIFSYYLFKGVAKIVDFLNWRTSPEVLYTVA